MVRVDFKNVYKFKDKIFYEISQNINIEDPIFFELLNDELIRSHITYLVLRDKYGLKTWTEYFDNGELLSYLEYTYHQNRQLATKKSFNPEEKLNGISETYHQNGQLASKINYKDGNVVQVIEEYDFNGNPTN